MAIAGGVGGGDDGGGDRRGGCVPASMARQVAPAAHGFDGGDADDGDVEAHVLIGLGDLDDGEGAARGWRLSLVGFEGAEELAGAGDGGVGAFHGFDGDAGLGGDDDGLAEVVGGDGAGDGAAVGDVFQFVFVWGRAR